MKILLANSPFQYYMTTAFFHPDWGALNLPQLAAMVGPKHEVRIVDNWHGSFRQEGITKTLRQFQPDILGFSNSTAADTERVLSFARKIRSENKKIFLIAGGQAASVRWQDCLEAGFNLVVKGEGEQCLKEVLDNFFGDGDFSHVPGIVFKNFAGDCISTSPRPFIADLDTLPFPAWHLVPPFRSRFFRNTFVSVIETSRGCPFGCNFCSIQSFWERSYRKKSNARIVEELAFLKYRLGCDQIYFIDDSFALDAKRYTELFEMMLARNLKIKGFSQIRPDTVANNPEMIALAARVGFWGFLVGFESYNSQELRAVNKVGSPDINHKAAEILRKNNIGIFGVHMFGITGSGEGNFETTFRLGMKNSDTFRMSRFSLIPGTPLFSELIQKEQVEKIANPLVPYTHKPKLTGKNHGKANLIYLWYEFRSLFGLRALYEFVCSRGIARKLKWRAYIVAFRYVFYVFCRKAGLPVL